MTFINANTGREKTLKVGGAGAIVRKNLSAWLILLPSILLLYYIVWRPIFSGLYSSFFAMKGYTATEFVGLRNYRDVISDTMFWTTVVNTVKYVGWSMLLGFPLPILVAILLNEIVHIKSFFKISFYFPMIIPGVAVAMIWYYMYFPDQSGLLNMLRAVFHMAPSQWMQDKNLTIMLIVISMTWKGFGGTVVMYLASLAGINQDLYEAAKIDGAGFLRRLWHVTFPQMAGVFLLMGARQIISVFQVMEQPMTMTGGGPNNASISLALQTYKYAFEYFQMDRALALGTVTFLMLLVFTIAYFFIEKKIEE